MNYLELQSGIIGFEKDRPNGVVHRIMNISLRLLNDPEEFEKIRFYERVQRDQDGNIVEFGKSYVFDFAVALSDKAEEKYPIIIETWKSSTCQAYKNYRTIKKYYFELKEKYNKEIDDDDF